MEFFSHAHACMRDNDLQRYVRIDKLPEWCALIDRVLSSKGDKGEIHCLWGERRVHREMIRKGVRFTFPTCPDAMQWTLTEDHARKGWVVVHCTTNRSEHDADYVASVEQFLAAWKEGLEGWAERMRKQNETSAAGECSPTFSGFG